MICAERRSAKRAATPFLPLRNLPQTSRKQLIHKEKMTITRLAQSPRR